MRGLCEPSPKTVYKALLPLQELSLSWNDTKEHH